MTHAGLGGQDAHSFGRGCTTASLCGRLVLSAAFILTFLVTLFLLPRGVYLPGTDAFLFTVGFIALWRYSWWGVHLCRAIIYRARVFPRLRARANRIDAQTERPPIYVLITSYKMGRATNEAVYRALFRDLADHGTPATVVAEIGEEADETAVREALAKVRAETGVRDRIHVVVEYQDGSGKRPAMANALERIRALGPDPDAPIVLMDGDSVLERGTLARCTSFLRADPELGALTTDNRALAPDEGNWGREWYDLRLAQRHLVMKSLALSGRLLVLTGRFSIFRARDAMTDDFISGVRRDSIAHWRFGEVTFLSGDDKSTWFNLLKRDRPMLYVPDVVVRNIEQLPPGGFVSGSLQLMKRWFGNMLRTSNRAIALGPRRMGLFVWWCLVDQRISMWTTLIGPTAVTALALNYGAVYFGIYLAWIMMTRSLVALIIGIQRRRISPYWPILLYYSQIVGAFLKVYVLFRINRQKWTRQGISAGESGTAWQIFRQRRVSDGMHALAFGYLVVAILLGTGVLPLPNSRSVDFLLWSTREDASTDDTWWVQAALDNAEAGATVVLPEGTLRITRPLEVGEDGVRLVGSRSGETRLELALENPQQPLFVTNTTPEPPASVPERPLIRAEADLVGPDNPLYPVLAGRVPIQPVTPFESEEETVAHRLLLSSLTLGLQRSPRGSDDGRGGPGIEVLDSLADDPTRIEFEEVRLEHGVDVPTDGVVVSVPETRDRPILHPTLPPETRVSLDLQLHIPANSTGDNP